MLHSQTQNGQPTQYTNQSKSVLAAGVAGILAGAAGVTVLALSDKDIRKRVRKKAQELKSTLQDWSTEKLQMADHHKTVTQNTVKSTEKMMDETSEDEPLKTEVKINN